MRILRCKHCGNTVIFMEDQQVTPRCCGDEMEELKASDDGVFSGIHRPIIVEETETGGGDRCFGVRFSKKGSCASYVTVMIGTDPHPMENAHYVQWIMLETNCGVYTKFLDPDDKPEATFCLCKGEKVLKARAYCSIHGLWQSR